MSTIRAIAQLIAERFDPERVVLFGSYARGDAGKHSDIDLLVEVSGDRAVPARGNPIRRAIAEHFVVPLDVIIRRSELVRKDRNNPYSLIGQALKEGVVLYDKNAA